MLVVLVLRRKQRELLLRLARRMLLPRASLLPLAGQQRLQRWFLRAVEPRRLLRDRLRRLLSLAVPLALSLRWVEERRLRLQRRIV